MQLKHILDIISLVFCKLQGPNSYYCNDFKDRNIFVFSGQLYFWKQKVVEFYVNPVKTSWIGYNKCDWGSVRLSVNSDLLEVIWGCLAKLDWFYFVTCLHPLKDM